MQHVHPVFQIILACFFQPFLKLYTEPLCINRGVSSSTSVWKFMTIIMIVHELSLSGRMRLSLINSHIHAVQDINRC